MIISKRFESRDKTVKNILILKVNNLSFKKKGTEIHFQIESKSKEIFTKSSQFSLNELKMNIDTPRSIDQWLDPLLEQPYGCVSNSGRINGRDRRIAERWKRWRFRKRMEQEGSRPAVWKWELPGSGVKLKRG